MVVEAQQQVDQRLGWQAQWVLFGCFVQQLVAVALATIAELQSKHFVAVVLPTIAEVHRKQLVVVAQN